MVEIPYTLLPSASGPPIPKPYINVILNYKKTHRITPAPIKALIDSGADNCLCSDMLGAWLGIRFDKIKETREFTAADGRKFLTKPASLHITICGKTYECLFYFSSELPPVAPLILGQNGFFDKFIITFNLKGLKISID